MQTQLSSYNLHPPLNASICKLNKKNEWLLNKKNLLLYKKISNHVLFKIFIKVQIGSLRENLIKFYSFV